MAKVQELFRWESPRNWKEPAEPGSWTSLAGFLNGDRRVAFLIIIGNILALTFALAQVESLAGILGISVEKTFRFVLLYALIFAIYLAAVGWELANTKSVLAVIGLNDVKENILRYIILGVSIAGLLIFFSKVILKTTAVGQILPLGLALTPIGIALVIFGSVGEESFFRGLVFPQLAESYGINTAMIVSGLIFMLFHFSLGLLLTERTPIELFITSLKLQVFSFTFAIAANYLTGATKSIIPSTIAHVIVNVAGV